MRVIDLLYKIANQDYIPIYIEYNSNGKRNVMLVCQENIIDKLDKGELYLNTNVSEYNPYGNEEKIKDLQTKIDEATQYILHNFCCDKRYKYSSEDIYKIIGILKGE